VPVFWKSQIPSSVPLWNASESGALRHYVDGAIFFVVFDGATAEVDDMGTDQHLKNLGTL